MKTSEESDQESFKKAMESSVVTVSDQETSSQAKKKENICVCKFCQKIFSRKSHLMSHITLIHEKFKDHTCDDENINEAFSGKRSLASQEFGHLKKELKKEIRHLKKDIVEELNEMFTKQDKKTRKFAA